MSVVMTDAWPVYQYTSAKADRLFHEALKFAPGSIEAERIHSQALALRQLACDILDEKHLHGVIK